MHFVKLKVHKDEEPQQNMGAKGSVIFFFFIDGNFQKPIWHPGDPHC